MPAQKRVVSAFRRRSAAVATVVVAVSLMGAACGGEQVAEQLGEQAINGDVEIGDDSISITDSQGNEFSAGGGTELPETWPADVPLYSEGELVLATSQSDGSASALWETSQSVGQAADAYDASMTTSGFSLDQDATIAGSIVRTYFGEQHTINVTVAEVDGTTNLNVVAIPR